MKDISYRGEDYKIVDNPLGRVSCDSCVFYKTHSNFGGYNPSCQVRLDMDYYKSLGYKTHEQSKMFSECVGVRVFRSNKKFKRRVLSCVG